MLAPSKPHHNSETNNPLMVTSQLRKILPQNASDHLYNTKNSCPIDSILFEKTIRDVSGF
jgi:hypothetical protein